MSAPELDVRYIAQLARIHLSEEEIATFQGQLSQVLEYVQALQKVDISGVDPMAHANPVFNVFRPDEPRDAFTTEEATANAPRKANGLFIVPKVVE
jgi:aspartyl-tRNA(Asn)/glutamyl-tRNA(Gln) amidotransferase subunit C